MTFKILSTTDVHGNLLAYNFVNSAIANKGLSRFSTFLKEERLKGKVIYVDNGDINQGTPLVTYANANLKENIVAKALNHLHCDYINIGNHDFNYGFDKLLELAKSAKFKYICANVINKRDKSLAFTPNNIEEVDGVKIGFFGLSTP